MIRNTARCFLKHARREVQAKQAVAAAGSVRQTGAQAYFAHVARARPVSSSATIAGERKAENSTSLRLVWNGCGQMRHFSAEAGLGANGDAEEEQNGEVDDAVEEPDTEESLDDGASQKSEGSRAARRSGASGRKRRTLDKLIPEPTPSGNRMRMTVEVPAASVGRVIGKGGQNFKSIKEKTGCEVYYHEHLLCMEVVSTATEGAEEKIRDAAKLIKSTVASAKSDRGDGFRRNVAIDEEHIGRVIGKKGETLKSIEKKHGVRVYIPNKSKRSDASDGNAEGKHVVTRSSTVQGKSKDAVLAAIEDINSIVEAGAQNTFYGRGRAGGGEGKESLAMNVERSMLGVIIGKGGVAIDALQREHEVSIRVPPGKGDEAVVTISGRTVASLASAKQDIEDRIAAHKAYSENKVARFGRGERQQWRSDGPIVPPGFITSATRSEIYELFSSGDPEHSVEALSNKYNLKKGKIEAVIQLEKIRSVVKRESTIDPRLSTIVGTFDKKWGKLAAGQDDSKVEEFIKAYPQTFVTIEDTDDKTVAEERIGRRLWEARHGEGESSTSSAYVQESVESGTVEKEGMGSGIIAEVAHPTTGIIMRIRQL